MRMIYRMKTARIAQEDLELVEDVLFSPIFIYLDIFLLSLIFSYMLFPVHHSLLLSIILFICFSLLGVGLFQSIGIWGRQESRE